MSNRGVVVLAAVAAPLLLLYLSLAYLLAVVLTLLVFPRIILARKIYWCVSSLRVVSILTATQLVCLAATGLLQTSNGKLIHYVCRCCPFIPHIFTAQGWFKGSCLRLGFETTYSINVLRRLLTLPIRPHVPDFYIVGFPVSLVPCDLPLGIDLVDSSQ